MTKRDLVVLHETLPRNVCCSKIQRTQVLCDVTNFNRCCFVSEHIQAPINWKVFGFNKCVFEPFVTAEAPRLASLSWKGGSRKTSE